VLPISVLGNESNAILSPNVSNISPQAGYLPCVGALVFMSDCISNLVSVHHNGLSVERFDYVFNEEANFIGLMMTRLLPPQLFTKILYLWAGRFFYFQPNRNGGGFGRKTPQRIKRKSVETLHRCFLGSV